MTEFDPISPEELSALENWFESPAFEAFCKVLEVRKVLHKNDISDYLTKWTGDEASLRLAANRSQRILELEDLVDVFLTKFSPAEEVKEPETKPKTFSDLLP